MKRLALAFVFVSSPAWPQNVELTPLASYTTPARLDQTAAGVQDLTINRAFTWGAQGTYFISPHVGLEFLWTRLSTGLSMSTPSGSAELFSLETSQFHGNIVYQFGPDGASWRPFVFGGVGATVFRATDLESETKPSWTIGGGLKWFLHRHVGLKAQARYKPSVLSDSSSSVCDPFGFCQQSLRQFELAGGAVFRF